jgi:predicted HTH domain antitoxin
MNKISIVCGDVLTLKQTALELLGKGEVTFAEAAGIAKLSLWEFADLVKQQNVEWVRFEPQEVESEFKTALV